MAHLARPLSWIEILDPNEYDLFFGSSPQHKKWFLGKSVTFVEMSGLDPLKFAESVDQAGFIYDSQTFEAHVNEDLKVIDQIKPDVVIGDFRHSLSISCRLRKVKYINLTNAYWSPDIKMGYPLPEAPIVRFLGPIWTRILIGLFISIILKINFFKMVFEIRKSLKKVSLKFTDYRQIIIDGDMTLYFDTPELVPLKTQKSHEKFVGPFIWSMPVTLPAWWGKLKAEKKRIFVSLGSSGNSGALPTLLKALSKLDVEVIVALAGKKNTDYKFDNIHITDFLPIEGACKGSSLVICNGGSPVACAALTYGVPVLGVIGNNDQLLNMAHLEKRGVGLTLRYWNLTEEKVQSAVLQILHGKSFADAAQIIRSEFLQINTSEKLKSILSELKNEFKL